MNRISARSALKLQCAAARLLGRALLLSLLVRNCVVPEGVITAVAANRG